MPVPTLLKLLGGQYFEVKVSGSFQNGNPDIRWDRGIVMTAKAEGLWDLMSDVVSREDVNHIKNRLVVFNATEPVQGELIDVPPCPVCFAQWLVQDAASVSVPAVVLPVQERGLPQDVAAFLDNVFEAGHISCKASAGEQWCADMGVEYVTEIFENSEEFLAFLGLKPLEEKRLRKAMAASLVLSAAVLEDAH